MTIQEQFAACAESYLGVKFQRGGRSREGVDCIGLICACLTEIGVAFSDRTDYSFREGSDLYAQIVAELPQAFEEVTGEYQRGDLLCFRFRKMPGHCAVYDGHQGLIHALEQKVNQNGKLAAQVGYSPLDESWRKRVVSVWRLKK